MVEYVVRNGGRAVTTLLEGKPGKRKKKKIQISGSQSGRYRPLGGGGITELGANRYERWKGALLLSQGALVDK
jgi:hypothetical protein